MFESGYRVVAFPPGEVRGEDGWRSNRRSILTPVRRFFPLSREQLNARHVGRSLSRHSAIVFHDQGARCFAQGR